MAPVSNDNPPTLMSESLGRSCWRATRRELQGRWRSLDQLRPTGEDAIEAGEDEDEGEDEEGETAFFRFHQAIARARVEHGMEGNASAQE